jgi:hypothetical protein
MTKEDKPPMEKGGEVEFGRQIILSACAMDR